MCNCSTSTCGCETIKLQRGQRGLPGQPGTAATITAGSAVTVPFGDPPTVTNSGTSSAAIFDFEIPAGEPGTNGTNGLNAYTVLSASFVVPANDGFGTVLITVDNNDWAEVGQIIFIEGAGYYRVLVKSGTTFLSINNLQSTALPGSYPTNAAPGTTIPSGNGVCPGGLQGPNGLFAYVQTGAAVPTANLGSQYGIYLRTSQNYWTWDGSTSGPWVDTGIPLTGPQGIQGNPGHTPVLTSSTAPPSGGTDGDWHIQQKNSGLWQVWARASGVWTALPSGTLQSGRILGSGATSPNLLPGLDPNANDLYFTLIGTNASFWQYTGATWVVIVTWSTAGGGGGADTLSSAAANSPTGPSGQYMGTQVWNLQRSIQIVPGSTNFNIQNGTFVADLGIAYHVITIGNAFNPGGGDIFLSHSGLIAGIRGRWTFEITNPQPLWVGIRYAAGKWSKNPGVTEPVSIDAGETLAISCEVINGRLNIVDVQKNYTNI